MTSWITLTVFWSLMAGCLCTPYVYEGVDLGAFPNLGNTPAIPDIQTAIQPRFDLYTRANPNVADVVNLATIGTIVTTVRPTIIIIHGFGSDCSQDWIGRMKDELLIKDDYNVFCFDWSDGAAANPLALEASYLQAVANTQVAGAIAEVFIETLTSDAGINFSDFYLIGHSLGAHVAGYAGERVAIPIGRITGLDPAGPAFQGFATNVRLDASDAVFVDVIHTNGNKPLFGLESTGVGIFEKSGHADFYVNGGIIQPGCGISLAGLLFGGLTEAEIEAGISCSHRRSQDLYIESINDCQFTGLYCANIWAKLFKLCDTSFMGFDADLNTDVNNYLVITDDDPLFCEF